MLGICRGMQLINVFFGGRLVPDLSRHSSPEHRRPGAMHAVDIVEERVRAHLESDRLEVNSYHGQGVTLETLAPDLR
ncbi:gamma-glutamyl-gamma-aminobutyrate hydrolase family protein, partial [Nitrospiraceae bacterium AH_259_D15_M11_P09]|nr:gamma-glutamyl-gamma-aminobutyrate hydrolase family protein [Nitrospiraceae bacterium AH_259_D15_M11_P09]